MDPTSPPFKPRLRVSQVGALRDGVPCVPGGQSPSGPAQGLLSSASHLLLPSSESDVATTPRWVWEESGGQVPNTEPGVHSPSDGGGVEVTHRVDPGALCNITAEKVPHSFRGCNGQTHNGKKNRNFFGENVQLSFADNTPWASLVVQMVKNLPAMWETWVRSLGQEDPLQEEMATYSSILPWGISQTEEPGGLQSMGSRRVRQNGSDGAHMHTPSIGGRAWASTALWIRSLITGEVRVPQSTL